MIDNLASSSGAFPLILRWAARISGLASLGCITAFAVSEKLNPTQLNGGDLLLFLCFPVAVTLGLLVGWRWQFAGGVLAVGGCTAFYGAHRFLVGSFPRGWAFILFACPGVLFLLSGLLARLQASKANSIKPATR